MTSLKFLFTRSQIFSKATVWYFLTLMLSDDHPPCKPAFYIVVGGVLYCEDRVLHQPLELLLNVSGTL